MDWITLINLILNNGLPLALKLYDKWGNKGPVTPEEIAELRQLAAQTPVTQMRDALARAGISPESEQGRRLIELVTPASPSPALPGPS